MENVFEITMQLLESSTAILALIFGLGVMCFATYCLRLMDKKRERDDKEN